MAQKRLTYEDNPMQQWIVVVTPDGEYGAIKETGGIYTKLVNKSPEIVKGVGVFKDKKDAVEWVKLFN
jgi:hypothetical protein